MSKATQPRLTWKLPGATDLLKVYVLRSAMPACPNGLHEGKQIGGALLRSSQVDANAMAGRTYCYAVYVVDTAGNTSPRARGYVTAPYPLVSAVTNLTATPTPAAQSIGLAWSASSHATGYRVYRTTGSTCSETVRLATVKAPTYLDTTAKTGTTYCYSVVAVGAGATTAKPADAQPIGLPAVVTQKTHAAAPTPAKSSSGLLGSSIARLAAEVGSGIVIFGLLALLAVRLLPRLRRDSWEYGGSTLGTVRGAMQRYDAGALVIPLVILVIGLVLLGAAAFTL